MKSTVNPQKGFESYFIRFDSGADLELMSRTDVRDTPIEENRLGLTHFAFALNSKEEVLDLTEQLRSTGYTIAGEPRTSGDGYFESVRTSTPTGNRWNACSRQSKKSFYTEFKSTPFARHCTKFLMFAA